MRLVNRGPGSVTRRRIALTGKVAKLVSSASRGVHLSFAMRTGIARGGEACALREFADVPRSEAAHQVLALPVKAEHAVRINLAEE